MKEKSIFNKILLMIIVIIGLFIFEMLFGTIGAIIGDFIIEIVGQSVMSEIAFNYLFPFFGSLCGIFLLMSFKKNRYMFKKFSLKNNKLLIGFLIGFVMNSICILIAYLNHDIKLTFSGGNILILLFAFFCVFIQSGCEEVSYRLYLYQRIKKIFNPIWVAIIVNSVYFSLTHSLNDGVNLIALTDILLDGIFVSLLIYYYDDIWICIGQHTAWNFTQNFIFGLPNSGLQSLYSIFRAEGLSNSFAYDIEFGIESSIVSIIITLIGIAIVYLINKRKKVMNS